MLKVDIKKNDALDIQILVFSGELDLLEKRRVDSYLSRASSHPSKALIVDLSRISLIDSSAIGLLVAHSIKLEEVGMSMAVVVDSNNYLLKKLSNLGIFNNSGVKLYETVKDAESAIAT